MDRFKEMANVLYEGDTEKLVSLIGSELEKGTKAKEILDEGLVKGMEAIGRDFKANILYMPEVLIAARAMNKGLEVLKPYLAEGEASSLGKIVIATVEGDLHDIGKNLVTIMWEGAGFKVFDLGIDVPAVKIVKAVQEYNPVILGLSSLITPTLAGIRNSIKALEDEGLRDSVKVIVGGAAVTEKFARDAGADGYADDAVSAVDEAKKLLAITG